MYVDYIVEGELLFVCLYHIFCISTVVYVDYIIEGELLFVYVSYILYNLHREEFRWKLKSNTKLYIFYISITTQKYKFYI